MMNGNIIMNGDMELEHAIGYSGINGGLHYHRNSKEYVYGAGGCVVVASFQDTHNQTFLRGHDANLSCLSMSISSNLIASGQKGQNSDVLVWDYSSKSMLYRFSEHDHGVACVSFSDDEKLLLSVGVVEDNKLFVWDLSSGNIVSTQQRLGHSISCATWGGMHRDIKRRDTTSYQFATAGKKSLVLWTLNPTIGELSAYKIECTAASMVRDYTCLEFSVDRELLFAGSTTGDFAVIHVKSRRITQAITACACGVQSLVAFSQGILVGGGDGQVVYYDQEMVDVVKVQLNGPITALALSNDNLEILAGSSHGYIFRVRLNTISKTMKPLLLSENHAGSIICVSYALQSDRFATISYDNTIRIWDASDYSVLATAYVQNAGKPMCLHYSVDILISGWEDGTIRCHSSDSGQLLWTIDNAHTGGTSAIRLSNNQRFIISGGVQGEVRVWDVRKRDLVSHLKEHFLCVTDLVLFDDDAHAISCSRDRSILCWNLPQERRISSHSQRMGGINAIALSQDQTQILTVGQEKKISYWDLRVDHPIKIIEKAHKNEATCIAVAHHLNLFATGGTDQLVKLWDFNSGKPIHDGVGHSGTIKSLAFSPDDRQLISVGDDGNIFIWNIYTP